MNIQALMKQAQSMQKDMMKAKEEIDSKEYEATVSFVSVKSLGNKKITSVKINKETLDHDDIEALEDMIIVAVNEVNSKIDRETEDKMGKYTKGLPGIF